MAQFVIRRALTQRQYLDDKQEVQERAARVRVKLIAREVRILAMDGFSPRLSEMVARNSLAVRFAELDEAVAAELGRLQEECHRKIGRLLENLEVAIA